MDIFHIDYLLGCLCCIFLLKFHLLTETKLLFLSFSFLRVCNIWSPCFLFHKCYTEAALSQALSSNIFSKSNEPQQCCLGAINWSPSSKPNPFLLPSQRPYISPPSELSCRSDGRTQHQRNRIPVSWESFLSLQWCACEKVQNKLALFQYQYSSTRKFWSIKQNGV